ncbi:helix-turn-helix domain-containing protein [Williamsia muralis]|uniref:helix-turn-helix domain-containing protein n=1 Tax=Williamsia marianensis TaxID=85044 RepID=UPI00381A07BC
MDVTDSSCLYRPTGPVSPSDLLLPSQASRGWTPDVLRHWAIVKCCIGAAKELSRNELRDVPIAAVARRCGFTNGSYFSKRFKTMYGLSPRAWRQMSSGERPQDSLSANPPA